jgi:hypothetical protein
MKMEGYSPYDKRVLTNSVDEFFYSPYAKKSWFLVCVFNQPEKVGDKADQVNKEKNDIFVNELSDKDKKAFLSGCKKDWLNDVYIDKARKIYEWYAKNWPSIRKYWKYKDEHYHDYLPKFGTFILFFEKYNEFSSTWKDWKLSNFGYGNKTWDIFVKWAKIAHEMDLTVPNDSDIEKVKKAYERR